MNTADFVFNLNDSDASHYALSITWDLKLNKKNKFETLKFKNRNTKNPQIISLLVEILCWFAQKYFIFYWELYGNLEHMVFEITLASRYSWCAYRIKNACFRLSNKMVLLSNVEWINAFIIALSILIRFSLILLRDCNLNFYIFHENWIHSIELNG